MIDITIVHGHTNSHCDGVIKNLTQQFGWKQFDLEPSVCVRGRCFDSNDDSKHI